MILLKFYKNILVSVVKLSLASIFIIASFYACTDYETILEDDWNEWVEKKNDFSYGSVIDNRDGHEYKTIVIGNQEWMAENLNYDMKNSSCYDGVEYNCTIYGHLYAFVAANIACFEGWHLPSSEEWEKLFDYVGGSNIAGVKLKSVNGWKNHGKGADEYGFAVLPVGYRSSEYMGFSNRGLSAEFWSSTIKGATMADRAFFSYEDDKAYLKPYYRDYRYSVRCVKDEFVEQESSSSVVLSSDSHEESSSSIMKSSDSSSSTISSSDSLENSSSFENVVSSSGNRDSVTSSSSENVKLSSSGKASWTHLNPAISYGEMIDARDGQVYKTIGIGEQTWMAENLNYETENSYCYKDSSIYCSRYGRHYTWATAMDSVGMWSVNGKGCGLYQNCSQIYPVRGVCPSGWHLPDTTEWNALIRAVGGLSVAGEMLKSKSAWNGVDAYGFAAVPDAYADTTYIWSATDFYNNKNSVDAYVMRITSYGVEISRWGVKNFPRPIRCVKDGNISPESSSSVLLLSSSSKASWAYLNPAISYGEMTDDRDGQVYKTVVIDEQIWMAENLNLETGNSYCYNDSTKYCDKYGRLYTWADALEACPADWHLPDSTESEKLLSTVGGEYVAGTNLKSISDWVENGNGGVDTYGFSAIPAGYKSKEGEYGGLSEYANFWLSAEYSSEKGRLMFFYYGGRGGMIGYNYKNELYSIRCLKNETPKSSSSITSSSSKASWAYLNPSYSYGEMTDDRDGQVYKTVEIGEQTWMAENLNYAYLPLESGSDSLSFCYDNDPLNCSKYGRLYRWSAAMDSVGMFSATGKGCGYSVCSLTGNVRGVCPEGWHLPSKNEFFNSDYSNPIQWQDSISSWYMSGLTIPASGYMPYYGSGSAGFGKGQYAGLWTSSESTDGYAFVLFFRDDDSFTRKDGDNKNNGYSVRCLKD